MAQPSASICRTLHSFYGVQRAVIPDYQRELAWDYRKMKKLWDDLFLHCQRLDPSANHNPYFIGAIIRNTNAPNSEIVDGQQRLVALSIISAGIRDALISTGNQDEAWDVHNQLIWDYAGPQTRLQAQDVFTTTPTAKPEQSTRKQMEPYFKLICPVYSGYNLQSDVAAGDAIGRIDPNAVAKWTQSTTNVHIFRNDKEICKLDLTAAINFVHGGTSGNRIQFTPIGVNLLAGDEIWISPNTKWSDDEKAQDDYIAGTHEFYNQDFRKLYLLVRSQAEHFIIEQKEYETISNPLKTNAKSVRLKPTNEHHLFKPGSSTGSLIITDSVPTSGNFVSDYDWSEIYRDDNIHSELKIWGKLRPVPGAHILRGATVSVDIVPIVVPHLAHNSTPSFRAACLKNLICDIWLVDIEFSTGSVVGKPVSHFIHTNNPSHRANLTTLDLLNALVHRIKDNPYAPSPHAQATEQTRIATHWTQIWDRLYKNMDKDPDVAQDFFYNWMIASKRWNGNARWKHLELYPGLQEHWEASGSLFRPDGNYDLSYLETEFKEMNKYSELYIEGIKPETIVGGTGPIYLHKKLLFILNKMDKQWMPAYLAIRYLAGSRGTSATTTLSALNGFLKSMVTLNLKYRYYPKFIAKNWRGPGAAPHDGDKFSPNDIHGVMDGNAPEKWIKVIHDEIVTGALSGPAITKISQLPKDVVNGITIREWVAGDPCRKLVNGGGAGMSGFLWAFETVLSGPSAPTGFHEAEIEHVLPKTPSKWVGAPFAPVDKWYSGGFATALHGEFVEMLGNKALISKQLNIHVKNFSFDGKKLDQVSGNPDCTDDSGTCTNHYDTSAGYRSITAGHPSGVKSYTAWDETQIISRTEHMMDCIIGMFNSI